MKRLWIAILLLIIVGIITASEYIYVTNSVQKHIYALDEIDKKIADLLDKLRKFKIEGDVIRTYSGPVVTTFEFKPAASVPVRKILNLQDV